MYSRDDHYPRSARRNEPSGVDREHGSALILVMLLVIGLMVLTALSLDMTGAHSIATRGQRATFLAGQIAESALAQALLRIRDGDIAEPVSGSSATAQWVPFSEGELYYYTQYDSTDYTTIVRAWGRIEVAPPGSGSTAAPDSSSWDGSGYLVRGVELSLVSEHYVPKAPVYSGNGGIERPLGGFDWTGTPDPADSATWGTVTSSPQSYQDSSVPFQVSALDHPFDYLYNGGTPTAASGAHPYNLWMTQNTVGQFNIEAWFDNSAGSGNDPTTNVFPPPNAPYFDLSDPTSSNYPYALDPKIPDVQTFSSQLWSERKDDAATIKLTGGSHSGTFGDLTAPTITFVTGGLTVSAGDSFSGAGILVIRDDYDANVDTDNTPSTKAGLNIQGDFEWTGLVILAGWAPDIDIGAGADATIVGSLFTEDSVQSGGEVSLDSSTVIFRIDGDFRLLYSANLFEAGGLIHSDLPRVTRVVVGVRNL